MRTLVLAVVIAFAITSAPTTTPADSKPDLKQLASARVAAAKRVVDLLATGYKVGVVTTSDSYAWSIRLLDAELDGADAKSSARAVNDHVDRMTAFATDVGSRAKAGVVGSQDVAEAEYALAEAKLWAARGKR
jgi:hypothetical protein